MTPYLARDASDVAIAVNSSSKRSGGSLLDETCRRGDSQRRDWPSGRKSYVSNAVEVMAQHRSDWTTASTMDKGQHQFHTTAAHQWPARNQAAFNANLCSHQHSTELWHAHSAQCGSGCAGIIAGVHQQQHLQQAGVVHQHLLHGS